MGFFSRKTTIAVSSVAYNIAGEQAGRANFLKSSLIYLNAAEESIGEKLPRMYLNGLGIKLKRAYKYAASLPQGLPTSSMQLWEYQDFQDAVQTTLDVESGVGRYKVEDAYLTAGNSAPAIENYLHQKYGWDAVTGKMTMPPPGFAEDADVSWFQVPPQTRPGDTSPQVSRSYTIEFRHDEASATADLTVSVSLATVQNFADSLLVAQISELVTSTRSDNTITRAFQTGDTNSSNATSTTTTVGSKVTTTTTTVTTTTNGTTTTVRTLVVDQTKAEKFTRQFVLGTGEWPVLDALWESRSHVEQTFFPSVPLRVDNKDMLADNLEGSANYKETVKLCELMGVNALLLRDQINSNPSVKDIDYAFLVAGANMNTQSQAEMDYLFRFWEMCMGQQTATEADLTAWLAAAMFNRPVPKTNSLVIQDPQSKNGAYKITIEWDYINKVTVNGTVSPTARVGEHSIVVGAPVLNESTRTDNRWSLDSTVVSIRRQISETQYEELRISGAVHKNDVYQGKTVETLAKDARMNPDDNEGFVIPLHMGIFGQMSLVKRTQFAQECMYLVFNCYVKKKQKWYQTGLFKLIVLIVLIIITIVSWGSATPATTSAWAGFCAAIAAAVGVSFAIVYFVMTFVVGYLVSYLLGKWSAGFAHVFGKKWGAIIQAVIAIVVSYFTGGTTMGTTYMQTAVQIIQVASQLFAAYARGASLERQDEFNAFLDKADEDKKLLEKLSGEFFGDNDLVSIDYLLHLQKTLREDSPTVFLSRTLMVGSDVVDMTMGMVSNMVELEISPRLPGVFI